MEMNTQSNEIVRKCENPKHQGENPPKLTKEESKHCWWLKDPEWLMWCPRCTGEWWKEKLKGIKKK